jgi:hypothetical protein
MIARVADDGHCPDDQQPPQISIALLGDNALQKLSLTGSAARVSRRLDRHPEVGGWRANRATDGGGGSRPKPVSKGPNSLLTGKLTGNFAIFGISVA